jgi:hypothetical protein
MSFIYYVLILILTYIGPAYAGLQVEKEVEDDIQLYAQAEVEVGELPSGKIKVFTDQTHSTTIVVDKQDCSIMRKKDDTLALGFKFGGLMWGFGPEIKIGHSSGVAWKHDVQRMVAEYQELCTQFNTGRLSQQEYQAEKQQIVQRGYNYARELEKRFKQKKDDMFKEMDQGKYIHLQNTRFYEGCCYYHNRPERNLVVEAPTKVVPVHAMHGSLGNRFFAYRQRVAHAENHHWDSLMNPRRSNRHNRHYVRPQQGHRHHNHRRHNNHGHYNNQSYNNQYYSTHRQHNSNDVYLGVFGNSNGQWNVNMGGGW